MSLAAFIGVLAATLVGMGDWALYQYGNRLYAAYLYTPMLIVAVVTLYFCSVTSYRLLGGGQNERTMTIRVPETTDRELIEKQETMRDRLRALQHFQETREGDLLSLITGDRVFRTTFNDAPCLAITLSGGPTLTVCQFETLARYVVVQVSISSHLTTRSDESWAEEER